MDNLIANNRQTMSSLEIAELTSKEHSKVLQDIERILKEVEIDEAVFRSTYTDKSNRQSKCYNLPRRECNLIVAGYSSKYRLVIIDRWEKLESIQSNPTPISRKQLALMVIEQEERLETLQLENDKMKPRSEFVDKVFNTDALIDIGEVAKILNLPYGRNTLFNVLREKGIFFKNKNEPFQQYVSKGYFEVKEKFHEVSDTKGFLVVKTYATQKGLGFIAKTLEVVKIQNDKIKFINT